MAITEDTTDKNNQANGAPAAHATLTSTPATNGTQHAAPPPQFHHGAESENASQGTSVSEDNDTASGVPKKRGYSEISGGVTSTLNTGAPGLNQVDESGVPHKYKIKPKFKRAWEMLIREHFSRDPNKWPIYAEPTLRYLSQSRASDKRYETERVERDEDHERLMKKMKTEFGIPLKVSPAPGSLNLKLSQQQPQNGNGNGNGNNTTDSTNSELQYIRNVLKVDPFLVSVARMSKNWEHSASVENVVSAPNDPAFFGTVIGTLMNANLVHVEYSQMAAELEKYVIRMVSSIVGYDPEQSTGIFTSGGTLCNLYGYLLGLRKSIPQSATHGMESGQDYRFINSQACHYSNVTNLSLLGANIESKLIRTRLTENNDMDLDDLEKQLRACFQLNITVPTIMLTAGSTDTFAIDLIGPVAALRDRLCEEFQIKVKPNVHVDSAVGWALIFFFDYDFDKNPLDINAATLHHLKTNVRRCKDLRLADSFTVDFHKWGFVPYTSSLVMIKNKDDLKFLESDPTLYSYFDKETEGHTHLHSTIECTRSASGVFAAAFAMHYIGKEGYQLLVAHTLQNAEYMKFRLSCESNVIISSKDNHGPGVNFRIYDPATVRDAEEEHDLELTASTSAEAREHLFRNSEYHYKCFKARPRRGLFTSWIQAMAHSKYNEHGQWVKIPGEKSVFFNPKTTYENIDEFVKELHNMSGENENDMADVVAAAEEMTAVATAAIKAAGID